MRCRRLGWICGHEGRVACCGLDALSWVVLGFRLSNVGRPKVPFGHQTSEINDNTVPSRSFTDWEDASCLYAPGPLNQ